MENNTTTTEAKSGEIQNIQKIVGEKTPGFIAKPIIASINGLEHFRTTTFSSPIVFYSIFIIIVILVVRFFWRLIFN